MKFALALGSFAALASGETQSHPMDARKAFLAMRDLDKSGVKVVSELRFVENAVDAELKKDNAPVQLRNEEKTLLGEARKDALLAAKAMHISHHHRHHHYQHHFAAPKSSAPMPKNNGSNDPVKSSAEMLADFASGMQKVIKSDLATAKQARFVKAQAENVLNGANASPEATKKIEDLLSTVDHLEHREAALAAHSLKSIMPHAVDGHKAHKDRDAAINELREKIAEVKRLEQESTRLPVAVNKTAQVNEPKQPKVEEPKQAPVEVPVVVNQPAKLDEPAQAPVEIPVVVQQVSEEVSEPQEAMEVPAVVQQIAEELAERSQAQVAGEMEGASGESGVVVVMEDPATMVVNHRSKKIMNLERENAQLVSENDRLREDHDELEREMEMEQQDMEIKVQNAMLRTANDELRKTLH